jgi:hypothetical protein
MNYRNSGFHADTFIPCLTAGREAVRIELRRRRFGIRVDSTDLVSAAASRGATD